MPISVTKEMIIMRTFQITLPDELHQRCKALAVHHRSSLKDLVVAAIAAYALRLERVPKTSTATPKKGGSR